ncbi:MAG: superoxide dismutase family protein [Candidatus Zixiibacteriota bacterium]|jgi:Cu-Zn family superoxide dismutase
MFKKTGIAMLVVLTSTALFVVGCTQKSEQQVENVLEKGMVTNAVAVMHPLGESGVHGVVYFTQLDTGMQVIADIQGLTPGAHGFHIHQYGDCTAPDGTSAGGHFNPGNQPHGAPEDTARHVGDLGNLVADSAGNAHYERVDTVLTFTGPNNILGRGIIIHAGTDDLKTQPTGAAGGRVACGVIGVANPTDK